MPLTPSRLGRDGFPRAAFTLIELLTVIAIIGILAAILIPTVGKVRSKAKQSVKSSNYRQIWLANALYANENKGRTCPTSDAASADWRRNLAPYIQMQAAQAIDYRRIPLFIDPFYEEYDETVNNGTRTGIGMSDQLDLPATGKFNNDQQAQKYSFLLSSITYPERRCFIVDSTGPSFIRKGVATQYLPGISPDKPRHDGKNMMVKFNGQVVIVSPEEALAAISDPSVPYAGP